MRPTAPVFAFACVVVSHPACGSDDGTEAQISIVDHADPLTSTGGDMLFAVTLVAAPAAYARDRIGIDVVREDGEKLLLPCDLDDADADLMLDPGEALHCREPSGNAYDVTAVGQAVTVELRRQLNELLAAAEWTPVN